LTTAFGGDKFREKFNIDRLAGASNSLSELYDKEK
jgi:hypothetical protein